MCKNDIIKLQIRSSRTLLKSAQKVVAKVLMKQDKVKFDGELREYPRFKKDFEVQVMPSLKSATALYTLRSCLGTEPLAVVKGVDDDITEKWKRLDERYGDPAKVANVIINSVQRVKPIKEGEDKRFIEFVKIVDSGYQDLMRISLEKEITTTSSIIEKRLPPDVRKDWAKLVSSNTSSVDKKDKFPSLLKFLLNQKRAIEYDSADLWKSVQQSVNHINTEVEEVDENDQQGRAASSRCLFHDNAKHENWRMQIVPLQDLGRTDGYAKRKACVLVLLKDRTSYTRLPKESLW